MAPRRIDAREIPAGHPLAARLTGALAATHPVTVLHDGTPIEARGGEPVALSLLGAGRLTLARSPKYHRPRGPSCLRGACDGCLVRVDGTPGVMACRTPARSGMSITSQNAFPTAGLDVFAVTDWFFPKHMDHHRFMVGMGETLNRAMQVFARRMAGIGTLPDEAAPLPSHTVRDVDVLVVGAGSSGTTAANTLSARGFDVLVVDEEALPGGSRRDHVDHCAELPSPAQTLFDASAVATYDNGTLVLREGAITLVRSRARVFANGCHDALGTFGRNDLPGIFTARAVSRALCHGILVGERVVIVGSSAWASPVYELLGAMGVRVTWCRDASIVAAYGTGAVSKVTLREGDRERSLSCDALVVADEPVASYELAGQAGAELHWDARRRCFAPESDDEGATKAPGVYVTGSLRRRFETHLEREADGARVALRVARDLGGAR